MLADASIARSWATPKSIISPRSISSFDTYEDDLGLIFRSSWLNLRSNTTSMGGLIPVPSLNEKKGRAS